MELRTNCSVPLSGAGTIYEADRILAGNPADGYMPFRTYRPFGLPAWEMLPSADGQLGAVVRLYREWRLSGDNI